MCILMVCVYLLMCFVKERNFRRGKFGGVVSKGLKGWVRVVFSNLAVLKIIRCFAIIS